MHTHGWGLFSRKNTTSDNSEYNFYNSDNSASYMLGVETGAKKVNEGEIVPCNKRTDLITIIIT